ncbi:MAG: hypothetical protein MJ188_08080 [Treponema sp.]|nr:hypothetical protein [Treponema sp.]
MNEIKQYLKYHDLNETLKWISFSEVVKSMQFFNSWMRLCQAYNRTVPESIQAPG